MPQIYQATPPPFTNKDPNITYVRAWPKPDDSYHPSTVIAPKYGQMKPFVKISWILEGQDREAAFVFALRRLYKTIPRPISNQSHLAEDESDFKQLIGLPNFGARVIVRNSETHKRSSALAVEQPEENRLQTSQLMFGKRDVLSNVGGPQQLCTVLHDAMLGLLNVFRMGYVHREITQVCISECKGQRNMGYMLSKDGKSLEGEPQHFSGMIYDFTVAKKMDGSDSDMYSGDTEIYDHTETTPVNLIATKNRADVRHSPIYDLESFFWVLLVVSTGIITDYAAGRRKLELELLKGRSNPTIDEKNVNETRPETDSTFKPSVEKLIDKAETETVKEDPSPTISESAQNISQAHSGAQSPTNDEDAANAMEVDHEDLRANPDVTKKDSDTEMKDNTADRAQKRKAKDEGKPKMSAKAKGKQKATTESDEDKSSNSDQESDKDSDTSSNSNSNLNSNIMYEDIFDMSDIGSSLLYYDMPFIVHRPLSYLPPPGFVPPPKPSYIAFAEDSSAFVVHTLLQPRRGPNTLDKITREHLMYKLPSLIESSPNLAPFRPLLAALYDLAEEYRVVNVSALDEDESEKKSKSLDVMFSREGIEEAFARYLRAFEDHMPKEDDWLYMQLYEGTDTLMKFGQQWQPRQFLGAFASRYPNP